MTTITRAEAAKLMAEAVSQFLRTQGAILGITPQVELEQALATGGKFYHQLIGGPPDHRTVLRRPPVRSGDVDGHL